MDKLLVKRDGDFTYPIYFENDFSSLAQRMMDQGLHYNKICIVTESNVAPLYAGALQEELAKITDNVSLCVFASGEENKNLETVQDIYQHLIEIGMDRKGLLVALGGGVTGDMTGFTAATYLRGIDFIQVPTTLLSQVDSSVGGKTGVDFRQFKNMVGAFYQPRLVYMNMNTLKTLPRDQVVSGMGEVLKTGLICDGEFFREVADHKEAIETLDPAFMAGIIRRCCQIKAGVVERDPKEQGERALLNLGHTTGHAVEKLMNFKMLHGHCVGVGMAACAYLSHNRGLLTDDELSYILNVLKSFGLPVSVSGLGADDVLMATKKDKKMENGRIKFVLMKGIGGSFVDPSVTDRELKAAIGKILE